MPKTKAFDDFAGEYDHWFVAHAAAYESELEAVRVALGEPGRCVEIGVGTGRFAAPLGIELGVEPSAAAAELARARGIEVVEGVAEKLPYEEATLDSVLMVTTICFVDDPQLALSEMHRVLKPGGKAVVGLIDADSALGREYRSRAAQSRFYAVATFFTAAQVGELLTRAGFVQLECWQTLFSPPAAMAQPDPVKPGCGEGSFVVMRASKPQTE